MDTPNLSDPLPPSESESPPARATGGRERPLTLRAVLAYQRGDQLSGWLISFAMVFSPWAFGTTQFWSGYNTGQFWSTWVMNATGYLLGALLALKWFIRRRLGYRPARWDSPERLRPPGNCSGVGPAARALTTGVAVLTVLILGYCLVAAVNARAVYDPASLTFHFQRHVSWLPHSYDAHRTWQGFFNYLALACCFWGARDWLLGQTPEEVRQNRSESLRPAPKCFLPARLRRLLWVMSVNGALLAAEGIAQRLSGSDKLLWLVQPRINRTNAAQFGPYAYRSNAAQYFNLVWPVTLGFWWALRREARQRAAARVPSPTRQEHWLLPGVLLMAVCPIMSYSRGGAVVALAGVGAAGGLFLLGMRRRHPLARFGILLFLGAIVAFGLAVSWNVLSPRLKDIESGFLNRESMNVTARNMAADYPWFGTGPGTFEPVFQLYRESPEDYWPAQLHNDWLETLITFGRLGGGLIGLAFLGVVARWFFPGQIPAGWRFVSLVWLALAGCLVHARYDYPFQVYSVLLLFLLLCAVLFSLSRPRS
jgi:hypothetical protein